MLEFLKNPEKRLHFHVMGLRASSLMIYASEAAFVTVQGKRKKNEHQLKEFLMGKHRRAKMFLYFVYCAGVGTLIMGGSVTQWALLL
ncbi:hypothetical protein AMTR_s00066p00168000 [Amborella trichopoda]|uniref:Uncharacterized protein n=1 Tax=Amborella trichopoda TaxID=13333 RepID=U5DFN5_AMBTC|nr:hypothetical protein AMTR_s00066p00168000 [Amborella trichopoda]